MLRVCLMLLIVLLALPCLAQNFITPCRVVDTRIPPMFPASNGGRFASGEERTINISASNCNIPATAAAYSLNITVVPVFGLRVLTAWPAGQAMPLASVLNSPDGAIVANHADIAAGSAGAINVYVSDASEVVIDVEGYYAADFSHSPLGPGGSLQSILKGDNVFTGLNTFLQAPAVVATPPTNSSAPCSTGQIIPGTDGYLYVCVATNKWQRGCLSSF